MGTVREAESLTVDDNFVPSVGKYRWRILAAIIGSVIVVIATGLFVGTKFVDVARRVRDTRHITERTRVTEGIVRDVSASARTNLLAVEANEREAATTLPSVRALHTTDARRLSAAKSKLAQLRRDTYVHLRDLEAANNRLSALQNCLDGISQAVNLLSVGDVGGWQRVVRRVERECSLAKATA